MNVSKLLAALVVPLCVSSAALAGDEVSASQTVASVPLTRAEVLADLQIWRESGMAALQASEEPAIFSPRYEAVAARYAAMRASPAFAALVQHIAQQRGEKVLIAGAQ